MKYAELLALAASYLNRSDLDTVIPDFIKHTEAEINRRMRHKDMIKRATAVADNQYMQLPGDFLGIINVDLQTSATKPLFQRSLESLDVMRAGNNDTKGEPQYFAVNGDTLELYPTPNSAYTLQLTYYAEIPPLTSTNDENFLSRTAPDIYLYGVLKHACIYLMEDERVVLMNSYFEKAMEDMRVLAEQAELGKGSLIPRRRTYGRVQTRYIYKQS